MKKRANYWAAIFWVGFATLAGLILFADRFGKSPILVIAIVIAMLVTGGAFLAFYVKVMEGFGLRAEEWEGKED